MCMWAQALGRQAAGLVACVQSSWAEGSAGTLGSVQVQNLSSDEYQQRQQKRSCKDSQLALGEEAFLIGTVFSGF